VKRLTDMSWNLILARSKAFEGSDKSIAVSIAAVNWHQVVELDVMKGRPVREKREKRRVNDCN
jgi:hypothetical protein